MKFPCPSIFQNIPTKTKRRLGIVAKWSVITGAVAIAGTLVLILVANALVRNASEGRLFDDLQAVEHRRAGLVLGCSKLLNDGRSNLYFVHRIEAAKKLYQAGKVELLIVSGDNGRDDYDEATDMMHALEEAGIPGSKIYRDHAGFRTNDSVIRAKEVFGQTRITIISQRFHNERAIYIARHCGLDAIGFNAKEVSGVEGTRTQIREHFARVKTMLDVLLGTAPRFLGPPVEVH